MWKTVHTPGKIPGYPLPCSQQNFPCVPVFPQKYFFDFGVPCFLKYIFFLRSRKVNGHVP